MGDLNSRWEIKQHELGADARGYVAVEYDGTQKRPRTVGSNYCAPELARTRIYIRQNVLGIPESERDLLITEKLDERFFGKVNEKELLTYAQVSRILNESSYAISLFVREGSKYYKPDFPKPVPNIAKPRFLKDEILNWKSKQEQQNAST